MLVLNKFNWPFFFFLGPVRGGGDWQIPAFHSLRHELDMAGLHPKYYASIPCRWSENSPVTKYRAQGVTDYYRDQNSWERANIMRAAKTEQKGCAIMWLARENETQPRAPEDGPYASESRFECGEINGHLQYDPDFRFVLGAEEGFPQLSAIRRSFSIAQGYDYPIYSTLPETIRAGIKMMQEKCS